MLQGDVPV